MPYTTQLCCVWGVTARLCLPGASSGLPCPVPVCCCRGRLARAGSGSHSGVELWRSRTGKGSSGGRKKGVVRGVGQERLGPSYFFISLVLGPLISLLWYVPSSRYIWSSAPIFLFQEQIKDIIIRSIKKDFGDDNWIELDWTQRLKTQ